MQVAKFINTLRQQLNEQVKNTLEISESEIHNPLQASLSTKINYYLQEFNLRCNAL